VQGLVLSGEQEERLVPSARVQGSSVMAGEDSLLLVFLRPVVVVVAQVKSLTHPVRYVMAEAKLKRVLLFL
jgi:hypothetical protein